MRKNLLKYSLFIVLSCLLASCKDGSYIETFDPMNNYPQSDTVKLDMQLDNSVFEGIVLPAKDKYFDFSAKIKQEKGKQLFYKIYYQNESYKFDEERAEANENFYGSWQQTEIGFKQVSSSEIRDSFQIVGNPRNEKMYYGINKPEQITQEKIEHHIRNARKEDIPHTSVSLHRTPLCQTKLFCDRSQSPRRGQ